MDGCFYLHIASQENANLYTFDKKKNNERNDKLLKDIKNAVLYYSEFVWLLNISSFDYCTCQ